MKKLLAIMAVGALFACNNTKSDGESEDGGPKDPPKPDCFQEVEDNGTPFTANWAGILPAVGQECIEGHFYPQYDSQHFDWDYFWFPLEPKFGVETIFLDLTLESMSTEVKHIGLYLYQSRYDEEGEVVGHDLLGKWHSEDGFLYINDFPLTYVFEESDDVFFAAYALVPTLERHKYKLTYQAF